MKEFERQIIGELIEMSKIKNVSFSGSVDDEAVEFSGAGYFLTIKDYRLPKHRIILDAPDIRGKLGGIEVGYLAFVENSELKLECFSYDQELQPKHRDLEFVRDAT